MNSTVKTAVFWVVMLCTAVLLWRVVQTGNAASEKHLTYTEFYKEVKAGSVESVLITNGNQVSGKLKGSGDTLRTVLPADYPGIIDVLQDSGVVIEVKESSTPAWLHSIVWLLDLHDAANASRRQ